MPAKRDLIPEIVFVRQLDLIFLLANSILNHFNRGGKNRLWKFASSSGQNNQLFSSVLFFL